MFEQRRAYGTRRTEGKEREGESERAEAQAKLSRGSQSATQSHGIQRASYMMYWFAWRRWGQGRDEGWVLRWSERGKVFRHDCGVGEEDREPAISGEGEMPTEKVGHTRVEDGGAGRGEKGELKAGLLVGFNYICLYLHNKQQPRWLGCLVCLCRF